MGHVYEAEDVRDRRVVAVKLLSAPFCQDATFRARMQREMQAVQGLRHPQLVATHDHGAIDGQLYVATPLIDAASLRAVLDSSGALPAQRAVGLLTQVAAGLDAAHAVPVLHRNLKPEKILVSAEDSALVTGLGVGNAATEQQLLWADGVDAAKYFAPERFSNAEVTRSVDVYALACVLFEALTGAAPYSDATVEGLADQHAKAPIPRAVALRADLPTDLDEVVARGLAKSPQDRYASAGELMAAAQQALSAKQTATTDYQMPPREPASTAGYQVPAQVHASTTDYQVPPRQPAPTTGYQVPTTGYQAPTTDYQVPSQQWAQPKRTSGKRRLAWAGAGVTAIVLIGAGAAVALTRGPSAVPVLAEHQLESVLVEADQLNEIMYTTDLEPDDGGVQDTLVPGEDDGEWSDPTCSGIQSVGARALYRDSGYTAVRRLTMLVPNEHGVQQAVVAFPSADQARAYLEAQAENWEQCSGRTLSMLDNPETVMKYDGFSRQDDAITIAVAQQDTGGFGCQRVLRAVSNVVLDVNACGYDMTDEGVRVADAMVTRLPQ